MKEKSLESTGVRRPNRPTLSSLPQKQGGKWHWFRICLVVLFLVSIGTGIGIFLMRRAEENARLQMRENAQKAAVLIREKNTHGNNDIPSANLVVYMTSQLGKHADEKDLPKNELAFLRAMQKVPATAWQEISRDINLLSGPSIRAQQKVIILSVPLWPETIDHRTAIYNASRKVLFQLRKKEDAQALVLQGLPAKYQDLAIAMDGQSPLWRQAMAGPINFAERTKELPILGGDHPALKVVTALSMDLLDQQLSTRTSLVLNALWEIRARLILRRAQEFLLEHAASVVIIACDEPMAILVRNAAHIHEVNLDTIQITKDSPQ